MLGMVSACGAWLLDTVADASATFAYLNGNDSDRLVQAELDAGGEDDQVAFKGTSQLNTDNSRRNRALPIAAIGGAILLFAGTWLHPMRADPNVPLAAFAEYAADGNWVASHLMQLAGVALMVTALVLLSRIMASGTAHTAAYMGSAGAIASLAVASALQAVDGVALKSMVNAWAAAPASEKEMLFSAAFAVRQIEIGLASMTALLAGLTISIYGIALLRDPRFPKLLGMVGVAGGIPSAIGGVVMAYTGFSDLAMNINLPANSLILCWMIALGVYVWREPARLSVTER